MTADAVSRQLATNGVRCNMPDPVPVIVLGRLAVDPPGQVIKLGTARCGKSRHRRVAEH